MDAQIIILLFFSILLAPMRKTHYNIYYPQKRKKHTFMSRKIPQLSAPLYVDALCNGFCTIINNQTQLQLMHTHDYYEVFLVIAGTAMHHVNGGMFPLEKGSLVFARPEDCHCYLPPLSSNFQLINLILTQKLMDEIFEFLGTDFRMKAFLSGKFPPQRNVGNQYYEPLYSSLNRLMIYPKESISAYNTAYKLAAIEIISHFFFENKHDSNPMLPVWLNKLIHQMYEPLHYTQGLSHIYELANCTPEHLCRSFQKYLHQSPTQFLNRIKLDEAARKLIYTDYPVITIAEELGFNNLSHFYHLFHDRYHMSPNKYRKYTRLSPSSDLDNKIQ